MKKVLLFGATGHAGTAIAKELKKQGYHCKAVTRSEAGARKLSGITENTIVCQITDPGQVEGICAGMDIVISSLGKSVSLNDRSKPSFHDIDLVVNHNILKDAINSRVSKFIYLSALHAEQYPQLEYFRVHHEFSELLKKSGLDFSIIKPPALFSAFLDLIPMAKKGRLITMGKGDKKTNPIAEDDLAEVCVQSIRQPFSVIEAGGPEILTRHAINQIIQSATDHSGKVRKVPIGLVKMFLPIVRLFDKNLYDKVAFFTAVMEGDTIAPLTGRITLKEYLERDTSNVKREKS